MVLIKTTILPPPSTDYIDNVLVSSKDGTIIYNVPIGLTTDPAPLYKITYNYSTGTGTSQSLAQQINWIDICCSSVDGSKIIAIYKDDSGEFVNYKFFAFNNDQIVYDGTFPKGEEISFEIHSCAMSRDGNVVYLGGKACVYKLNITSWTTDFSYELVTGQVSNPDNLGVHHICCSGNGEIGWCSLSDNQPLSIFKLEMVNGNLTANAKINDVFVSGITCNELGDIVAATDNANKKIVYISTDSGDNWTEKNTVDNGDTLANNNVHLSNSGREIIVGVIGATQNGFLDYTYDVGGDLKLTDGSNGAPELSLTSTTQTGAWSNTGISGDGKKFFGVIYDNGMNQLIILNWYSGPTPPTPSPPTPSPIPLPISDICFIAGTPIVTNQGIIPIEKINPKIHTIRNKKIIAITQTISQDDYLVCFEQNSLGPELPTKKTIMSKDHKLFYKGKIAEAKNFLGKFNKVTKITYNGEILYNVLMDECYKINVNNLTCETLDPENVIAKLYTEYYDENYKKNVIIKMNDSILKQDYPTYKNLVKSIMKK